MSDGSPAAASMRVALLNPCFWPEVHRGSERVIHDLARELVARGHRVRLITGHPGRPRRSVEDGIRIERHWRPLDDYLHRRMVQEYLTHTPFSYASLRLGNDDVAHACFPTDAAAAVRWARAVDRPAVFSYNGIPQRYIFAARRFRLRLLREALSGSDAVVMPSRAAVEGMRRWFGIEARVIYPGVDLRVFASGDGRAEYPTILCAAPWEDGRKRVPLLVEAFERVRREIPECRLLLLRPNDPNVARNLDERPGIELFDPTHQPGALAGLYRRSWVSALTSYNEAFGLVLVEALACGTPVVASDDGGPREIVDRPEIGRLFKGEDAQEVARALIEALELSASPSTASACTRAAERFSTARCAEEHEALYRLVAARRRDGEPRSGAILAGS